MLKKTYWLSLLRTLQSSWSRFLALASLLTLSAFVLVGLQLAGPSLDSWLTAFKAEQAVPHVTVLAKLGFSQEEKKELEQELKEQNVTMNFGYMQDVLLQDGRVLRLFSLPDELAQLWNLEGQLPSLDSEIVLGKVAKSDFKQGQDVELDWLGGVKRLTITGFAQSSQLISQEDFGPSLLGQGQVDVYGFVPSTFFKNQKANLAQIGGGEATQNQLEMWLADQESRSWEAAQADLRQQKKDLQQAQQNFIQAQEYLSKMELERNQRSLQEGQQQLTVYEEAVQRLEGQELFEVLDMGEFPGSSSYTYLDTSITSLKKVANWIPPIFYGVTILVALTSMVRLVQDERQNMGLLSALGYGPLALMFKFVSYGLLLAALGAGVGGLLGVGILAPMIQAILLQGTVFTGIEQSLSWPPFLWSLGLGGLSILLPLLWLLVPDLRQSTSQLMRPKPPSKGKRIFLERLPGMWSRLNFSQKLLARNLFRYKQRMLMTVLGVLGSIALLVAALGLQVSIAGVADKQFHHVWNYDALLIHREGQPFHYDQGRSLSLYYQEEELDLPRETGRLQVLTQLPNQTWSDMIRLEDWQTGQDLDLEQAGVVLSQPLAEELGVSVGDHVSLVGKTWTVGGIVRQYVGYTLYLSPAHMSGDVEANAQLWQLSEEEEAAFRESALKSTGTLSLEDTALMESFFRDTSQSLNQTMYLVSFLSLGLVVIILITLTLLNLHERTRELATMKVLGFYPREMQRLLYKELLYLTSLGALLGLVAGYYLHGFLLGQIAPAGVIFSRDMGYTPYLLPLVLLMLVLMGLYFFIQEKINRIPMLDALKSLE
ncbi:ABC transporter permease [Streptococcus sp. NLN76]|uniref:ABC transporter permease n=1 Tax=Streptococcus sp. NLN76 TaxID=2822800 RepID=UPI0018A9AA52|nr:ABC transporter permease [Streptococcus sp. NLN76]MBF8969791.1 hypothetical protein [Streptococcus sp. NLN76]